MKNKEIAILKNALTSNIFDAVDEIQIFQNCKTICKYRNHTNLRFDETDFDIFITIDSEMDEYPINLPNFASSRTYLENCRQLVIAYICENKESIISQSKALLKKLTSN